MFILGYGAIREELFRCLENDPARIETAVGIKMDGNFNDFLWNLGTEHRKLFRQYENFSYRIINTTYAIKFNNICLQEHLCPKTIMNSDHQNIHHNRHHKKLQKKFTDVLEKS